MLLFPLIHLAKFKFINDNWRELWLDQQTESRSWRRVYFFLCLLQSPTKKNKQTEMTQKMGKYNSTRVAVSKKYTWGLGSALASSAHTWGMSTKRRRESINQKWDVCMYIYMDYEFWCSLYSGREKEEVNLALKYIIKICFLSYILHSGAQLTGHHFTLNVLNRL